MNDLSFLDEEPSSDYGSSDATLKAVLPGGKVIHISDHISPLMFLDTCPLLYHTFEYNSETRLQSSIEVSSETAIVSLARYCYTGSYLATEPDGDTVLLLQHAETYKIAEDFDVPELQIMAHGNFSCQIEYACCLPSPPRDLLDTIRFIYRYFASDEARRNHNLVETLLNYCVAVYSTHRLGEDLDFLTAVHEISAFRQDLCRTNIARNFEDECAADIIRLPSGSFAESSRPPTTLSSRDLPEEMLYNKPDSPNLVNTGEGSNTLSSLRKLPVSTSHTRDAEPFPRQAPNLSQHSVEPSTLTKALNKLRDETFPPVEVDTAIEQTLRKYKRARFAETEAHARMLGQPILPEGGLSSGSRIKQEKVEEERPTTGKLDSAATSDEESYWEGAFNFEQTKKRSSAVKTEGTSPSARRLLFEYGRRNVRSEQKATLSPPKLTAPTATGLAATTLPHRPRDSTTTINPSTPSAPKEEEEEPFTLISPPLKSSPPTAAHVQSPMSSPELIPLPAPAMSIAQTLGDDKGSSDDEWTVL